MRRCRSSATAKIRISGPPSTVSRWLPAGTITTAEQLHGKELSYNNINDANAALQIVKEFNEPAVVAVKHMNPCGVGIGARSTKLTGRPMKPIPSSIFGGIVAANRHDRRRRRRSCCSEIFLEIVIAPDFTPEALEILTQKKNIRSAPARRTVLRRAERLRAAGATCTQS